MTDKSDKIKCSVPNCDRYFNNYNGLSNHVRRTHEMTKKEYYDMYIKKDESEGKCRVCGKETAFANINTGYLQLCSIECVGKDSVTKKKRENTALKHFGVKCNLESKEQQEKIKQTNLEKYGVPYTLQVPQVREKGKQTWIKKYGVDNPWKSEKIKRKIRDTNLKVHGTENPMQSPEIQNKTRQTNLEKYGVEYGLSNYEVRRKIKQTNLEKYGVENVFASEEIKEKIKQKQIQHYNDWLNLERFLEQHNQEFTCIELSNYFSVHYQTIRKKIRAKELEHLVKDFYSLSAPEQVFSQELDKLNIEYELHNRKVIAPQEIDFYLPEYKLAIEVSPTWTHQYITEEQTEQNFVGITNQDYHYNKFKLCKEQGIELITIFDWTDQEKVINFIKSKTLATETIYARKTTTHLVKGLTKKHKDFLDRNHILGKVNNSSTTEVVEMYNNIQLVGLAVFEKKTKYTELRRLAFEGNYRIPGGASKLIKTFAREHPELKELITFSDNDLGTGHVYEKLGFKILEENKGTLIWYNDQYGKKIPNLSLIKQGTDRLLKNFPGYEYVGQGDDLPGNEEIIQWYGFVPIYDCGYTKWSLAL